MKIKLPLCAGVALLALGSAHLFAYALLQETWTKNRTVVMQISVGDTVGSDGISYQQSCVNALNEWNQVLVHMQFAAVQNSPVEPVSGDGDNSVFFDDTVFGEAFGSAVGV